MARLRKEKKKWAEWGHKWRAEVCVHQKLVVGGLEDAGSENGEKKRMKKASRGS